MAAKVLDFAKKKTFFALKKQGESLYFKVVGTYSWSTGTDSGSVWNSSARANDWAKTASEQFGGTWKSVKVIVTASVESD